MELLEIKGWCQIFSTRVPCFLYFPSQTVLTAVFILDVGQCGNISQNLCVMGLTSKSVTMLHFLKLYFSCLVFCEMHFNHNDLLSVKLRFYELPAHWMMVTCLQVWFFSDIVGNISDFLIRVKDNQLTAGLWSSLKLLPASCRDSIPEKSNKDCDDVRRYKHADFLTQRQILTIHWGIYSK